MNNKPWENEPDFWEGESSGLFCIVIRMGWSGVLNGYVGLPKTHPCFELDYSNCPNLEVHGGLTFSGAMDKYPDLWFLGFDCGHYRDLAPNRESFSGEPAIYRDFPYVKNEVEQLAAQLSIVAPVSEAEKEFRKEWKNYSGYGEYTAALWAWNSSIVYANKIREN